MLTLAVGIGASTAIFSAVNPVLFEPLPYPDSGDIVTVSDFGVNGAPLDVTFGTFRELVERSRSLEAVAVMKPWDPTATEVEQPERVSGQRVSARYFDVLGVQPTLGRSFTAEEDLPGGAHVVILSDRLWRPLVALISESFARKFASAELIGARIQIGSEQMPWYTIVGIVGDVKQISLASDRADAVYVTPAQWTFADNPMSLVVRTSGDAAALVHSVRAAIWSVDKDQAIIRAATMDSLIAATASERRFTLFLFEAFSGVALLLAAIGIYGVLAAVVSERTREIGVRSALGATRASIIALVLRQGFTLTISGAGIGIAGGFLASRGLLTLLFNTSGFDPVTYSSVVALLVIVALIACWIPASRAARVDPVVALRSE